MALPDSLYISEDKPRGHHGEQRPRSVNSFLPYRRTYIDESRPTSDVGLRSAGGFDANPGWRSAVERPKLDTSQRAATPDTAPTFRRRLLWEIRDGYHCSICGTCLSFAELGKIAGKAGLQFEPDESEHAIHGHFVQCAAKPGRLAKLIQKFLDRKYRSAVERFRRAKSDAQVGELWSRALAEGDVPGPYWALMTHPRTTTALRARAFGEVHMLSHLAGATNRADIRRLRVLEGEQQALSKQLVAARHRLSEREAEHRRLAEDHQTGIRELTIRLRAAQAAEMRLERTEGRLRELEGGDAFRMLCARNTALESELGETRRELRSESQRRSMLERELSALHTAHHEMSATVRALNTECDALESMLQSGIDNANGGATEPGAAVDLRGRRIAYIGGRAGLVGHFRALVERLNGHFIHHDGGIEDHEGQLGRILGQADVVLCPVDCVSHRACLRAKRFCKRTAKSFVPLRSAGLSSFVTGLRRATECATAPLRSGALGGRRDGRSKLIPTESSGTPLDGRMPKS